MEVKIRILVVGDAQVGKTAVITSITQQKANLNAPVTIGFFCDIMFYEYRGKQICVEFLEIGGSNQYEESRSVFCYDYDGIIFVYDVSSKRTYLSFSKWMNEINDKSIDKEDTVERGLKSWDEKTKPILQIGTKSDTGLSKEFTSNKDAIIMSAKEISTISPGYANYSKFTSFLDKVLYVKQGPNKFGSQF